MNQKDSQQIDAETPAIEGEPIVVRVNSDKVVSEHMENTDIQSHTAQVFEPTQSPTKPTVGRSHHLRRLVIGSIAGLVLVGLGVAGYVLTRPDAEPEQVAIVQEVARLGIAVTVIDGTANYSTNGVDWMKLTTETELKESDSILTDSASRVVLTLDDGSALRLSESTSATLASLLPENVQIINNSGQVYSRVVASDRVFMVSIEDTDYRALGTAFNTINTETNKGVQVLQSSVSVDGLEAPVEEGKQFYKAHATNALKETITDVSVDELKSSSFMIWNLEQDEKTEAFKDKLGYLQKMKETTPVTPVPEVLSTPQVKLSGSVSDKGAVLKWSLSGVSAPDGFKIVRTKKSATPTYGQDDAKFVEASARSYTWGVGEGGLYNYRICVYVPKNKTCTPYSNTIKLESPEILPEQPVQGTVNLLLTGSVASWTDTGTAPHGWKLLVSTNTSPTYGGDNAKTYYTEVSPKTIEDLAAGTYYVRVCKYTATSKIDNGCTNYSNELTLVIP